MKIDLTKWQDSIHWQMRGYNYHHSCTDGWSKQLNQKYYSPIDDIVRFAGEQLYSYVPKDEFINPGKEQIKELLNGKNSFYKEVKKRFADIKKANKELLGLVESENIRIFRSKWKYFNDLHCRVLQLFFSFDFAASEWMEELQKENPKLASQIAKTSVPTYLSFIQGEENELIRIKKIKDKSKRQQALEKHVRKWRWIQNSYTGSAHLNLSDFLVRLSSIKKEVKFKNVNIGLVPKKYKLLVKTLSLVANLRDERKKMMLMMVELMELYLRSVAKKIDVKYEELVWFSFDEVEKIVKTKNYKNPFYKKQERFLMFFNSKTIDINKGIFQKVEKMYLDRNMTDGKIIKGVVANKGFVKGRVRVVKKIADCSKMKRGEILVTSMTRPDFISAMKKASAFVTDEGGITCHAAIVAREMKKPCIIGTKIATKIFKDGDLVEVDANKGVVKIIK